jgi:geranylgeranyl pyrophosphate synthase
VLLGALAQGSTTDTSRRALDTYAQCIGLAFQITDDILDVEGDANTLGKTPGADQALNKPTYPAVMGLEQAKAKRTALTQQARAALVPLGEKAKLLTTLARFVIERNR